VDDIDKVPNEFLIKSVNHELLSNNIKSAKTKIDGLTIGKRKDIATEGLHLPKTSEYCMSGKEGKCNWLNCPQLIDGEPDKSGRNCPLDKR